MGSRLGTLAASALLLAGCAALPSGPSELVLPGGGVSFQQFQQDDDTCRDFASHRVGLSPQDAAVQAGVGHAAIATAVGAAAGAAMGSIYHEAAHGAAWGAGSGLLFGALNGSQLGTQAAGEAQHRYDNAYVQCMYASGHQVPVPPSVAQAQPMQRPVARRSPPPRSSAPPPPPRGEPPPPPPDV